MTTIYVCDLCGERIDANARYRVHVGPIGIGEDTLRRNGQFMFHGEIGADDKSCYAVFLDALEEALRSASSQRPESPRARRERELAEMRARGEAWRATAGEQRQRLILEALGTERLTVGQIADRLTDQYREDYGKIFDATLRNEVRRMLNRGELDRVRADKDSRPRYVYFRKTDLSGPIADLQAMLDHDREDAER